MNQNKLAAISTLRTGFVTIASLALFSCITDSPTSSSSTSVGPSPITLRLTITSPLKQVDDSTLIIVSSSQVCEDSVMVETQDSNTVVMFQIEESSLTIRPKYFGCTDFFTSSTANGLRGVWQYKGSQHLRGFEDEFCETDDQISSIEITDSTYSINFKLENICWSTIAKESVDDYMPVESISTPDCQTIVVTDSHGNVAKTILTSIDAQSGEWSMIRKYNGKSCRYTQKEPQATPETCQSAYAAWKKAGTSESFEWKEWFNTKEQQEYNDCVSKLGVSEELEEFF